jgi:exonuclease SbcC
VIKQLHVKNFKSHEDTTIQFHPGINVITGASDAGKSTLLKALLWVQTNRPTGLGMVSFWNRRKNRKGEYADPIDPISSTISEIILDSGETVARIRNSDRNGYNVGAEELGAIGTEVPQSVLDTLNMSDLNVAKQFDPPFLIGESAGEVARYLNKLIKIDEIDTVLSKAESRKRAERKLLESTNNALETSEAQLKLLQWVEEADKAYDDLSKLDNLLDIEQKVLKDLTDISLKAREYEEVLDKKKVLTKASKIIKEIDEADKDLNATVDTCLALIDIANTLEKYDTTLSIPTTKLNELVKGINARSMEIAVLEEKVKKLKAIKEALGKEPPVSMKVLSKAQAMLESIEELDTEIGELSKNMREFTVAKDSITKYNRELERNTIAIYEAKNELPDTCPLCGNEISKEHTHE